MSGRRPAIVGGVLVLLGVVLVGTGVVLGSRSDAGTAGAPRVIRGETITFAVTTMGPLAHEFMVGPAAAVAADQAGTPEIADIGMMDTKTLTYTFEGSGPYAFACHAPGHYEAGMRGTITVVG